MLRYRNRLIAAIIAVAAAAPAPATEEATAKRDSGALQRSQVLPGRNTSRFPARSRRQEELREALARMVEDGTLTPEMILEARLGRPWSLRLLFHRFLKIYGAPRNLVN